MCLRLLTNALALLSIFIFQQKLFAAGEAPQSITLSGTLFSSSSFSDPLLDASVVFRVQVLNPDKTCILYEETLPAISTLGTNGAYNLQVGTITGHPNRSGDDPGHAMADILQNVTSISATNPTCVGGIYNPAPGDVRHLRVYVDPSSGPIEQMSPDMALNSVPNAIMCESVQGLDRDKLAEFGTHIDANMTAANLLSLFDGSDASSLHTHDSEYAKLSGSNSISLGSQQTIGFGEFTTAQESTLTAGLAIGDAGKTWFNSTTGKLMYWSGSAAQEIGTGTGAVSSVFGRTGTVVAVGGDYNAGQVTNTPSGNVAATNVQAAINEIDSEKLALSGGVMTGSLDMNGNAIDMGAAKISDLADPTLAQDAATKAYVDSSISAVGGSFVAKSGDSMTGALAMGANKITGLGNPTAAQDAATKNYVDSNWLGNTLAAPTGSEVGQAVRWNAGGTAWEYYTPSTGDVPSSRDMIAGSGLTGGGTLAADRTFNVGAGTGIVVNADDVAVDVGTTAGKIVQLDGSARLPAVDGSLLTNISGTDSTKLPLAGGTMSGAIAMGTSKITGLGNPTAAQDAATKTYVDNNLRGSNLPAPGAGQDGQSIQWNNGTGAWVYYTPSTGDVSSSRDMIAGSGLTGGGTLAADRTFNVGAGSGISVAADSVSVDINGTTAEATIADGDEILIHDVSAGALRKMTKANFVSGLGGGGLANVVEDTTPQLGGNLDVNGNDFTSAAGVDFAIGASAGNDFTVDTDKLVVEGDTGNVGIGTTSPSNRLDVSGDGGTRQGIALAQTTAGTTWHINNYETTAGEGAGNFGINLGGSGQKLSILASNGNVGIGTSTPAQKLDVNGNVQATAYFYTSDRRLKTHIEDIKGLEYILKMKGVRFDWIKDGKPEIGLIAQEVEEVLPELVYTNPKTGMKSVKYGNIVAPLIQATKELYEENQALRQEMALQQERIESLEDRLERIEKMLKAQASH